MRARARSCAVPAWVAPLLILVAGAAFPANARAEGLATPTDLSNLSIEDLASVTVSSVAKADQPLIDAPAAIYVISHDDIIRSGATTIPEMLRLAPNLEVAQVNANTYAISARGFNVGNNASMSDKLLVLIDGRSIYTPLFAGVYWDMQGVFRGPELAPLPRLQGPAAVQPGPPPPVPHDR